MKLKKFKSESVYHSLVHTDFDLKYRPKVIAVDTECTGLKWALNDSPFAISVAFKDADDKLVPGYFEWPVNPMNRKPIYSQAGLNNFTSYYYDPKIIKVFANAKFDIHMLFEAFGFFPRGPIFDVLIAAWCCKTDESSYKLNNLAEKYAKIPQDDEEELKKEVKKARLKCSSLPYRVGTDISKVQEDYWLPKFFDHDSQVCQKYAVRDAVRTLELYEFYKEGLEELGVKKTFEIEMKVLDVILEMEERGIRFFDKKCKTKLNVLYEEASTIEKEIRACFNAPELNLNSPKQLREFFFSEKGLNLPVNQLTTSGQPSVSMPAIKEFKNEPIIDQFLQYKGLNTGIRYLTNYESNAVKNGTLAVEDMPDLHQKVAIHPSFNQIAYIQDKASGTRTGRLSSSDPNLQNVSDELKSSGMYVVDAREYFGPRNGYTWYCIDYSQLELRIFAERTGSKLKEAFLTGRDPHNETRECVPFLAAKDPEIGRKLAKNTNFTIINCGGAGVLEEKYGMPLHEGKQIVNEFYKAFPETRHRQKKAEQLAITNGYIETLFGRKINVDLTFKWGNYLYAYRATSYDIQGSAADIIKRAMIGTHDFLSSERLTKYDAHLILSIHDELIFEIKQEFAYKWILRELVHIMERVANGVMDIPLKCDITKTTTTWASKSKQKVSLEEV